MCDQQSLRSACAYALECSMNVKLLNEQNLELLSLNGGCTRWSESTHVKMPHCWKSHVAAHLSMPGGQFETKLWGSVFKRVHSVDELFFESQCKFRHKSVIRSVEELIIIEFIKRADER